MRSLFSAPIIIALFANCTGEKSAQPETRVENKSSVTAFDSAVRELLMAGDRADSSRMAELTSDKYPLLAVLKLKREEPELIHAALQGLSVTASSTRGDTAGVVYTFPYKGDSENMGVTFLRADGKWRIHRLVLTKRM